MTTSLDIVIRGGTVADGTGADVRTADVGIRDGLIVEVGQVTGSAARTVDADGLLVTPGFVDIHTHYDGQATWDSRLAPSSWHGVTTVVTGNCGVGFAPIRAYDRDRLIELMEGVEDIPGSALHEGLSWEWESFADYMAAVERLPHDVDIGLQIPHAPLRLYVMGDRAWDGELATDDDIAEMAILGREAVEAGALGFSTSRTISHRCSTGAPICTLGAAPDELIGIAAEIGKAQRGVLQVVTDLADIAEEVALLRELMTASGRPLSFSLLQSPLMPELYREALQLLAEARSDGLEMTAQVAPRGIGMIMGLDTTFNPFTTNPVYAEIRSLPRAERVSRMRDPSFRQRMLAASTGERAYSNPLGKLIHHYEAMYEMGDPPNYEPDASDSILGRAERSARHPEEIIYDILISDEGQGMIYLFIVNFVEGSLEVVREMLSSPYSVVGLSDGGAHVGLISDASFPTTLLSHWGRDRSSGRLPIPFLVERQTRATARTVGLHDRGVLAPGYRADVNVVDLERLRAHRPDVAQDLPAGGSRLLQRADGYVHTFVAGEETYCNGEATGALPGRLVRG